MYKLKIINDKNVWNNFIINNNFEFYSFLCSWEWWEVQILSWKEIFRYWIFVDNKLIWIIPLIKNKAKRWVYLFSPHCPLILEEYDYFELIWNIMPKLKEFWKKHNANFLRFNSPIKNTKENYKKFQNLWFINSPMHEHAEDTHLLKLDKSEEELLSWLKKWDRYYIKRALKEWVSIRIDNKDDHINTLISMHNEHAKKTWYHMFSRDFILNLYKWFWDNISTISANYNWVIESILMTIKFWETSVYYIAASDIKNPKFSPNYLCQYSAILNSKKLWCKIYNFWWVSPDDNKKHPIAWVSKFKKKFWWYDYSLLHAQDYIINFKYWFNYIIETVRRKKRAYYYKKPI